MAFKSLGARVSPDDPRTRLDFLPLVLAGPILRKVTPSSVTVWLALRAEASVTLTVQTSDAPGGSAVLPPVTRKTVRVGQNLHLLVITARRQGGAMLQPATLYFYNLTFRTSVFTPGGETLDLGQAIGGFRDGYAYGTHSLPGFVLPPANINQLRLIQGSCRKPNSGGPDLLARLDDLIDASFDDPIARPHQLFLGGDQIYADEVADTLLLMLSDAAKVLVGAETLPGGSGTAESVPPSTRSKLILDTARLTTEDSRSHLISLGEYLAMYLFAWSEVLWPATNPTYDDVLAAVKAGGRDPAPTVALRDDITEQAEHVNVFRSTLHKVRRALANIPTYMICDDHEVTDDWNLSREFCDRVYGTALGTRIIRNGVAAYALCQHWGNAPEQFEVISTVTSPAGLKLLQSFAYRKSDPNRFDTDVKRIVGVHTPAEMAARTPYAVYHDTRNPVNTLEGWVDDTSLIYNYTVEGPTHQVIVTDTRTWRSFPRTKGTHQPGDLIGEAQVPVQIGQTPDLNGRMLIVLFTTNFPPSPALRQAARDVPNLPLGYAAKYVWEDLRDSWELERGDYARMLAQLSRKFAPDATGLHSGAMVVLSGDVHSSSASRIHYRADAQYGDPPNASTRADLTIGQLIASGFHNQNENTLGEHAQGYEFVGKELVKRAAKQQVKLGEDFIGWNPGSTADGTKVGSVLLVAIGDVGSPPSIPVTFTADKPIVTLRYESFFVTTGVVLSGVDKAPDYRLHLQYLVANSGTDAEDPPPDLSKVPIERVAEAMNAYYTFVRRKRARWQMVGMNNLGEVRFAVDPKATVKKLAHFTAHWFEAGDFRFVQFDVALDPQNDIANYPGEA